MSLIDSALNLNHFLVENCYALLLFHSVLLSVDNGNLLLGDSKLIGVDNTLADLNALLLTESMSLHIVGLLLEINKLSVLSIDISINSGNVDHIAVERLNDVNNCGKLLDKCLLVVSDLSLKVNGLSTCGSNGSCSCGNGYTCGEVNGNIGNVGSEVLVDSLLKRSSKLVHCLTDNLLNLRRNINADGSYLLTGLLILRILGILRGRHNVRYVLRGSVLRCCILGCCILRRGVTGCLLVLLFLGLCCGSCGSCRCGCNYFLCCLYDRTCGHGLNSSCLCLCNNCSLFVSNGCCGSFLCYGSFFCCGCLEIYLRVGEKCVYLILLCKDLLLVLIVLSLLLSYKLGCAETYKEDDLLPILVKLSHSIVEIAESVCSSIVSSIICLGCLLESFTRLGILLFLILISCIDLRLCSSLELLCVIRISGKLTLDKSLCFYNSRL